MLIDDVVFVLSMSCLFSLCAKPQTTVSNRCAAGDEGGRYVRYVTAAWQQTVDFTDVCPEDLFPAIIRVK